MSKLRIVLLILMVLATFSAVQAQTATPSGLLVYNAWVRPTAPAPLEGAALPATPEAPLPGTVTGGYMTIENTGDADYTFVGIAADFSMMSMLHQMSMDDKGVMRMGEVEGLDIPAGETLLLAPGGYHAMFMDVMHDIYPGAAVALTLTFANADGETFNVPVGALASDFPPEESTLIAANASAQVSETGLDVSLILDNRSEAAETLTGVTSIPEADATLVDLSESDDALLETLDIAPTAQTSFSADGVSIRLPDLGLTTGDAFPLTLTFESGKTLTVAVPVIGESS